MEKSSASKSTGALTRPPSHGPKANSQSALHLQGRPHEGTSGGVAILAHQPLTLFKAKDVPNHGYQWAGIHVRLAKGGLINILTSHIRRGSDHLNQRTLHEIHEIQEYLSPHISSCVDWRFQSGPRRHAQAGTFKGQLLECGPPTRHRDHMQEWWVDRLHTPQRRCLTVCHKYGPHT